ncbi:hypothetical protein OSI96_26450, partial [Mycobacterium ulcerans]
YSNGDGDDADVNYSRGGEFLENMMSGNHLEFCKRWLHLGDFKEVVHDMEEYYDGVNHVASAPVNLNPNDVVYFGKAETEVISFMDRDYNPSMRNALFFYGKFEEKDKLIDDISKGAFI